MKDPKGLSIDAVEPQSIAEELGIQPGDKLLTINDQPVRDVLDYRFLSFAEEILVKIITRQGEVWEFEIEKDAEEGLGLDFGENSFGPTRRCHNRCLFCFVDQMAPAMRKTLYVKDDDYRLSFWQGNFVSLTNVRDPELQRIIQQKLSPLYISVHTTNPELRCRMLNNRHAGKIMEQLQQLAQAGITMHTQMVLCPGINDGQELERSIRDLSGLWPQVHSLAAVPVGVTKYRDGLFHLRPFSPKEAGDVVAIIENYQRRFMERWDYPFVYASDEFYLLAGKPIPLAERYADFPQTENGVGLSRLFLDEWDALEPELPSRMEPSRSITMVTGVSGSLIMKPVVERLNRIQGLQISLEVIANSFFGQTVTVTGLLTGQDIIKALKGKELGDLLILPSVMLRQGEEVFLDDFTVTQVSQELQMPIEVVEGPREMVEILCQD
ncbi:DUF512 domain-containing protein [Desulforamulus ruminis]|uniref:PDZ domain-containing protein n=1 Tax=Desulforamulus ruminis (strain ATCC 23193 / DSM 2154 / NCIMB 8452 / DL) TaxID=696281 RepID=F6DT44_DESRL|nr:DUF512 domain-containing protein [Desulforamulus ruminis]AEG61149.1 protein of unknown function DUF512 [Desulforamulus ruminis DSM 2154]